MITMNGCEPAAGIFPCGLGRSSTVNSIINRDYRADPRKERQTDLDEVAEALAPAAAAIVPVGAGCFPQSSITSPMR